MSNITVYVIKDLQKNSPSKAKHYTTTQMRKDLVLEVGANGYVVFEQMMNRQTSKTSPMTDEKLSDECGLTVRQVANARRALTKHHWFRERKTKNIYEYFIGKMVVLNHVFGEVELDHRVKTTIRDFVMRKLNITSEVENIDDYLAEFDTYTAKALQAKTQGVSDQDIIIFYKSN
ncbi:hypothetical protein [Vibrio crassostreae]|uniref:hypothetical protein n=1 Tax=Vibrio crassostreae TaxID=246167 RepID=UPI001B30EA33|nr:hypothetical protein [Vibrio crassostreae]